MSTMEYLLGALALARNTSTSVVDARTPAEWLRVYDAYRASDWDIAPDRWTAEQLGDALRGLIPQWNADIEPIASKARSQPPLAEVMAMAVQGALFSAAATFVSRALVQPAIADQGLDADGNYEPFFRIRLASGIVLRVDVTVDSAPASPLASEGQKP